MNRIALEIRITADEYQKVYAGVGRVVITRDMTGRRVQFPARILLPFVTRAGIEGRFEIVFDERGKFQSIARLA